MGAPRFVLAALMLGCGARTNLSVDDGVAPALEDAGDETSASIRACPRCTSKHTCSGPQPCLESDGCTYGWCDATGFRTNNDVCLWPGSGHTWCNAPTEAHTCPTIDTAGPVPTTCSLNPTPSPERGITLCRESGDADPPGQACGMVRCGKGCTCLCENFCWCTP